jgi:hypothetical protein
MYNKKNRLERPGLMAYEVGDEIPETFEELDDIAARVYSQGVDAGKAKLRADIKEFLTKEFFAAKGKNRRADQDDPKIQAINGVMERLYAAFEDGTL